ncbi:hypothetical protein POM88_030264 [Heracleum sosnowskyi]|uniref:Uncharacterized protein n=1 Tax=Heracleum sosnowskyi TaxID=360622 RepID=A0AAD8MHY0_9APIA|nr:hypothetical protein POM88_030264 [Heracleum sosnowskyi]
MMIFNSAQPVTWLLNPYCIVWLLVILLKGVGVLLPVALWFMRNQLLWKRRKNTMEEVVNSAQGRSLCPSGDSWHLEVDEPDINSFKVNIDAAVFEEEGSFQIHNRSKILNKNS